MLKNLILSISPHFSPRIGKRNLSESCPSEKSLSTDSAGQRMYKTRIKPDLSCQRATMPSDGAYRPFDPHGGFRMYLSESTTQRHRDQTNQIFIDALKQAANCRRMPVACSTCRNSNVPASEVMTPPSKWATVFHRFWAGNRNDFRLQCVFIRLLLVFGLTSL